MKWVFGFLLVLNVALVLWATGQERHRGSGVPAPLPAVKPANMRLLTEKVQISRDAASSTCMHIGPFEAEINATKAARQLDAKQIAYLSRTIRERKVRAYRVYLGPFDGPSAADAARRQLRSEDVTEYYLFEEAGGDATISLGLFSQQTTAQRYIEELVDKEVMAKWRPEERTLSVSFWLELSDPRSAGVLQDELRAVDWIDPMAQLRSTPCR